MCCCIYAVCGGVNAISKNGGCACATGYAPSLYDGTCTECDVNFGYLFSNTATCIPCSSKLANGNGYCTCQNGYHDDRTGTCSERARALADPWRRSCCCHYDSRA
jgi:hypothetical protein